MPITKLFNYRLPDRSFINQQGFAAFDVNGTPYLSTTRHINSVDFAAQNLRQVSETGLSISPDNNGLAAIENGNIIYLIDGNGNISRITFTGSFPADFKHTYDSTATWAHFLNLEDPAYGGSVPGHTYYIKGKKFATLSRAGSLQTKTFTCNCINFLIDYFLDPHYGPENIQLSDLDVASLYEAQERANYQISHNSSFSRNTFPAELNTAAGTEFSTWNDYFEDNGITADNPTGLIFDREPHQIERFMSSANDTDLENKMMIYGAYNGRLTTRRDFIGSATRILNVMPGARPKESMTVYPDPLTIGVATVPITETVNSVTVISDKDVVGSIERVPPTTNERFNRMSVEYNDIANDYALATVEIPRPNTALRAQLDEIDTNVLRGRERIEGVNNKNHATMLAIHKLLLSHRSNVVLNMRSRSMRLEIGDVVSFNTKTLNINRNEQFRLINISDTNADLTHTLTFIEFKQSDYYPYLTDKYRLII